MISVAYSGFHKGGKFSQATSAHTNGGPKHVFPISSYGKKFFFAKKGDGPIPPKFATV